MEKRDKEMPYEVIIQERNKVDLYGNVVYYIYWFDKYGNDITNEWKFWSKGPKKKFLAFLHQIFTRMIIRMNLQKT